MTPTHSGPRLSETPSPRGEMVSQTASLPLTACNYPPTGMTRMPSASIAIEKLINQTIK